jgi:SAM-dependent methyltransferase
MQDAAEFRLDGEVSTCPECGSPVELLDYGKGGGKTAKGARIYFVSGCRGCGLIFTNPPPSADELQAIYAEGGHWRSRDEQRTQAQIAIKRERSLAYVERILDEAARAGMQQPHIFDFGCGFGEILDSVKAKGWRTTGLDPATTHIVRDHEMISEVPTTASFDVIVAKHVIEHLGKPISMLRQLRAALKPGGFMLLGQPCLDNVHETGKRKYCINNSHHFTAYTRRSITHLLRVAGLDPGEPFHLGLPHRFAVICRHPDPDAESVADPDPIADARAELARCRGAHDISVRALAQASHAALARSRGRLSFG